MAGPETDAARADETRAMALAGVAARIVNAGVVFLTQVLFARALGVAEFGAFATANTLFLLVAGFATFGLVAAPQRFWPRYAAAGDHAALRGFAAFCTTAPIALGALFAAAAAIAVWLFSAKLGEAAAAAAFAAMIVVPAQASLDVVEGIALARAGRGSPMASPSSCGRC
jgi:O-antigen/teichoic acid export membrane protein